MINLNECRHHERVSPSCSVAFKKLEAQRSESIVKRESALAKEAGDVELVEELLLAAPQFLMVELNQTQQLMLVLARLLLEMFQMLNLLSEQVFNPLLLVDRCLYQMHEHVLRNHLVKVLGQLVGALMREFIRDESFVYERLCVCSQVILKTTTVFALRQVFKAVSILAVTVSYEGVSVQRAAVLRRLRRSHQRPHFQIVSSEVAH